MLIVHAEGKVCARPERSEADMHLRLQVHSSPDSAQPPRGRILLSHTPFPAAQPGSRAAFADGTLPMNGVVHGLASQGATRRVVFSTRVDDGYADVLLLDRLEAGASQIAGRFYRPQIALRLAALYKRLQGTTPETQMHPMVRAQYERDIKAAEALGTDVRLQVTLGAELMQRPGASRSPGFYRQVEM